MKCATMPFPANELEFGQFERDTLPGRIAARLLALIADRHLRPGDRLPPERELAATMRVSRASLREALAGLAMVNIVEIRQGSGVYVTSLKPELLVEHLDLVFALNDTTFSQLLEARQMIEPGLAALAAAKATDAELAALQGWLERSAEAVGDEKAFLRVDLELHDLIASAARNHIISHLMASLTRLGMASRQRTGASLAVRQQSHAEHRAIVEALLQRDGEAAAAAMQRHLCNIQHSLSDGLSEPKNAHGVRQATPPLNGGNDAPDHDMG